MSKRVTAFACAMFAGSLFAQSVIPNSPGTKPTVAIRNATIYPVTSAPIEHGTIVFANGTITAVGKDVAVPPGAMVIDGTGLRVYPGLIDSGTQIGLVEINAVPGTVDDQTGAVAFAPAATGDAHDVTDEIARRAWLSGARVLDLFELSSAPWAGHPESFLPGRLFTLTARLVEAPSQ